MLSVVIAAIEWGTVGEWVGGLAAALGLAFAAYEIRASIAQRREEEARRVKDERIRREAMARAVSVSTTPRDVDLRTVAEAYRWADIHRLADEGGQWYHLEYSIHNGGDLPINNVVLFAGDVQVSAHEQSDLTHPSSQTVIGTIAAGATEQDSSITFFRAEPALGELTSLAYIEFTDAWSQSWRRRPGELVRTETAPRIC